MAAKKKRWSHSEGQRGLNRVTVYEIAGTKTLYIDLSHVGGKRQALYLDGVPITDRVQAIEACRRAAQAAQQGRVERASRKIFGLRESHTLAELLDELHVRKESGWKPNTTKGYRKIQRFWKLVLGAVQLEDLTAADVVQKADEAAFKTPGTWNHHIRYLLDALGYAVDYLKWLGEDHRMKIRLRHTPKAHLSYSELETVKLLRAAPQVDLRLSAMLEIIACTGQRENVVRGIRLEHLKVEPVELPTETGYESVEVMQVFFPEQKNGEPVTVPISASARLAVERLLAKPMVQQSGWLFPNREDLDQGLKYKHEKASVQPWGAHTAIGKLRIAEFMSRVPTIERRAFHGLKRFVATFAVQSGQLESAALVTNTTQRVLGGIYADEVAAPKVAFVRSIDEARQKRERQLEEQERQA